MVIPGGRYDDGTSTAARTPELQPILTLPIRTDLLPFGLKLGPYSTDAGMLGDQFVCEAKSDTADYALIAVVVGFTIRGPICVTHSMPASSLACPDSSSPVETASFHR